MTDGVDPMLAQGRTPLQDRDAEAASPSEADGLGDYRRRKLELAELIRALMSVAAERHDDEKRAQARDLLARLAEDAFQLAVVGQFSRGKSTLMNATLGRAYLPTGALPMTSVVTTVRYGSRPRALVERAGSTYPFERPLGELARFVAQASLEREELRVVSALVEVPAEILRLGFLFVDTPGVGSAIEANTATTESFLPLADAVIFVTSFDAPLSEAELSFLAKVRRYVDKLFLVVNKLDLVSSSEAERVLDYVRERVAGDTEDDRLRLFATSARQALEARERNDQAAFVASGLAELEQELLRFLTTEKARVFLQQVAARAIRLLTRQRLELELGRLAQSESDAEAEGRLARFDTGLDEVVAAVSRDAARLHDRIKDAFPPALAERSRAWPPELTRILAARREQEEPPPRSGSARRWLADTQTALLHAVEAPLEGWMRQRVSEARALLVQVAAAEIDALQRSQQSVEPAGADAFGVAATLNATAEPGWLHTDLPQLAVRSVSLRIDAKLPWWLALVPVTRLTHVRTRLLADALAEAVTRYCTEVEDTLVDAANHWAELVGSNAEAETRKAIERLRERLRLPGSERHLHLLAQLEQRLDAFATNVAAWQPPTSSGDADLAHATMMTAATPAAAPCEICRQVAHVPFDFLADVQYELATREQSRKANAAQGGFCALHTWQYAETASDLGIALTYAELAAEASRTLRTAVSNQSGVDRLRELVLRFSPGRDRCPVCRAVADAEHAAIAELIETLPADPDGADAPPLCMPHLAAVLAANSDANHSHWLAANLAAALTRVADDMSTYALKRESLRRHLMNEDERASYLAAIAQIAAQRELVRPWRNDDEDRVM